MELLLLYLKEMILSPCDECKIFLRRILVNEDVSLLDYETIIQFHEISSSVCFNNITCFFALKEDDIEAISDKFKTDILEVVRFLEIHNFLVSTENEESGLTIKLKTNSGYICCGNCKDD